MSTHARAKEPPRGASNLLRDPSSRYRDELAGLLQEFGHHPLVSFVARGRHRRHHLPDAVIFVWKQQQVRLLFPDL